MKDYLLDDNLMTFLSRHLKRKKKYYAMIEYIRSKFKTINKTLHHSIDKHNFKLKVRCRGKQLLPRLRDVYPAYASGLVVDNEIDNGTVHHGTMPSVD